MFWNRVKQISAEDAKALIEKENALMVDVRKPKDYEKSHVDGAILVDKNLAHEVFLESDKERPIICYCCMGISSRVAVKNLKKAGFTQVLNLKGGYDAWEKTWPTPDSQ
jgi:rhodanese-related sulfurtransferase